MLQGLRKVTRGWVAGVLIALLAVAFAIWGINDVFRPVQRDEIASGKGVKVTASDYRQAFDRALENIQRDNPQPITQAEARAQGLDQLVLQRLVGQAALDAVAARLGLRASDALVANDIRETEAFKSQITGAFDADTYRTLLAQNGIPQELYEREVRGSITRKLVADAVGGGVRAPSSFGAFLVKFESERRTVSVAELDMGRVGAQPDPTEAEVQALYKANEAAFKTPEFRKLTVISATPADFEAKVDVPESRITELFAMRQAQPDADPAATLASQRDALRSELARDEALSLLTEAIDAFEDARSGGQAIEAAAAAQGLRVSKVAEVDQAGLTRAGTPALDAALSQPLLKAAFAAPVNETSEWVNTPEGGSYLALVESVTPPGMRPLSEVSPQLVAMFKSNKAREAMDAIVEAIRKDVAAGRTFAQAAQAQRLPVVIRSQPIDRRTALGGQIQQLGAAIFGAGRGEVVSAPAPNGAALLVAQVESIDRADPAADPALLQLARQQADGMLGSDILAAMQSGAIAQAQVKTNQTLLSRTLGDAPSEEPAS